MKRHGTRVRFPAPPVSVSVRNTLSQNEVHRDNRWASLHMPSVQRLLRRCDSGRGPSAAGPGCPSRRLFCRLLSLLGSVSLNRRDPRQEVPSLEGDGRAVVVKSRDGTRESFEGTVARRKRTGGSLDHRPLRWCDYFLRFSSARPPNGKRRG